MPTKRMDVRNKSANLRFASAARWMELAIRNKNVGYAFESIDRIGLTKHEVQELRVAEFSRWPQLPGIEFRNNQRAIYMKSEREIRGGVLSVELVAPHCADLFSGPNDFGKN